jgi:AcrR family transcriptional regulator
MAATPRTRLTADERREHVLHAAICGFAETGYHGTSTEAIARDAGISQPYLFRLYGTKKDLFLACVERCYDRTVQVFRDAAEAAGPAGALEAMGAAYVDLLADRELLLFQLQTYAAAADDDIRAAAKRRYEELVTAIAELGGTDRGQVLRFFGQGMLLNVVAALDLDPESFLWRDG